MLGVVPVVVLPHSEHFESDAGIQALGDVVALTDLKRRVTRAEPIGVLEQSIQEQLSVSARAEGRIDRQIENMELVRHQIAEAVSDDIRLRT